MASEPPAATPAVPAAPPTAAAFDPTISVVGAAPALAARGLTRHFDLQGHHIEVLRGVDLTVAPGEWVVLTGKSGCGKTTLLHLLGTLDRPNAGNLFYFGERVTWNPLGRARLRRRYLGFIFQSFQLFPELSAWENVTLAGQVCEVPRPRERARALLDRVGLAARLAHRPTELSGGEQQRVAIARALMNEPRLIFADEPTGNLDPQNSAEVMAILQDLRARERRTIVMVTHDRQWLKLADRAYTLDAGVLKE